MLKAGPLWRVYYSMTRSSTSVTGAHCLATDCKHKLVQCTEQYGCREQLNHWDDHSYYLPHRKLAHGTVIEVIIEGKENLIKQSFTALVESASVFGR